MIFLMAKNTNFYIFADRSLKPLQLGSLIRWTWWCDFHPWFYDQGDVSPFFRKSGKFSQARNLWWVRLNLLQLCIWNQQRTPILFYISFGIEIPFFRVLVTIESDRCLLTVRYHELLDSKSWPIQNQFYKKEHEIDSNSLIIDQSLFIVLWLRY